MTNPVRLEQSAEVARFDPARLEQLCREKGEAQAETEAAEALSVISQLLRNMGADAMQLDDAELREYVDNLRTASDRIGMSTLARVAGDVRDCLDNGDQPALAATLARLYRVGDRSIHAIFDLDDQIV